ncbi:hypothetical protein G7085_06345 [Tessaracoccus sp. HDW20]|uniref:hypothetical protein n=1 Tax=Tessaracoccus coleopterorum TaxID=2714950 RepID=UPI0018D4C374|nr:hypothetical protein [Tessaracoccus coleopterorum]NHB84351.1 hypothetical protein [Tessaracoccus coleopterorum]
MWRQAVSELRLHPGRFVATLIAIAISVGFIAAISVFVNSQQTAMGSLSALPIAKADLVLETTEGRAGAVADAATAVEGVTATGVVDSGAGVFLRRAGVSMLATLYQPPRRASPGQTSPRAGCLLTR